MPSKIDVYQIGVWFCVGFFTGAGWAIAGWRRAHLISCLNASARHFVGLLRGATMFGLWLARDET